MSMARAVMPKNNLVDSIQPRPLNSILLCTFLLLFIGLLMMTSASVEIASSQYSDPFFFLKRQLIFAVVGVFVLASHLTDSRSQPGVRQSWYLLMGSFRAAVVGARSGCWRVGQGQHQKNRSDCLRSAAFGIGKSIYSCLSSSIHGKTVG